jgi:hypothetical protein
MSHPYRSNAWAARHDPESEDYLGVYLSSQTSSMRQPLKILLTMTVHPLPTHRATVVKDDRPGAVFGQLSLNFPQQLLALLGVRLNGLPLDQFVDLSTTIAVVVQLPAAPVR